MGQLVGIGVAVLVLCVVLGSLLEIPVRRRRARRVAEEHADQA